MRTSKWCHSAARWLAALGRQPWQHYLCCLPSSLACKRTVTGAAYRWRHEHIVEPRLCMNLPQFALRRPFTVIVIVIAVALVSVLSWRQMPKDIFPTLGIPTIYIAQPYGGMDPAQMEGYLTYYYEYHFLYVAGIEHIESKSIQGAAIIKLQFHPGTNMPQAMAETGAYVNAARAFMPAGTLPPFITRFDAGSVPVGQLVFSSETRSVTELQDAALKLVRPFSATLPGVSAPPPLGGSARRIVVSIDPAGQVGEKRPNEIEGRIL